MIATERNLILSKLYRTVRTSLSDDGGTLLLQRYLRVYINHITTIYKRTLSIHVRRGNMLVLRGAIVSMTKYC